MIRAFLLYTGPDGHSHFIRGHTKETTPTAAQSISFSETPAGSSLDWHNAPTTQFVITLSGTLEFTTRGGETFTTRATETSTTSTTETITTPASQTSTTRATETFTIHPGDILIAKDTTGSGHKWRLTDDQPWRRAYVIFNEAEAAAPQFIPDTPGVSTTF